MEHEYQEYGHKKTCVSVLPVKVNFVAIFLTQVFNLILLKIK